MKQNYFLLTAFVFTALCACNPVLAQIKIGGLGTPNPAAVLELESTNQGFLPPRLTTSQRDAIVGPVDGMLIYNSSLNCLQLYSNGGWTCLGGSSPAPGFPPRLSNSEIEALPSPLEGDLAYDKTFHCLRYYNGTKWLCSHKKAGDSTPEATAWKTNAQFEEGTYRIAASNDGSVYTNNGGADGKLARYDQDGTLIWNRRIINSVKDLQGTDLAVDPNGNVYMVGTFGYGGANFGSTSLSSYGNKDIFIVKYNSNGDLQWVQQAGGAFDNYGTRIAVDASSNVYVSGLVEGGGLGTGTAGFGSITFEGSGYFLAKYNSNGVAQWVQKVGGSVSGIATQSNGAVYITGTYGFSATFGSTTLTGAGNGDAFVAKYTGGGAVLWAKSVGGSQPDYSNGIAVDANGNVFIVGAFSQAATFGSVTLTSNGNTDIFIAKYTTNGSFLWVKQAGGASEDSGQGIATDSDNSVYVTGGFSGTASFASTSLSSQGGSDIFLAKYDNNGTLQWVEQSGGAAPYETGTDLVTTGAGSVFITGYFGNTAMFGATSLTTSQLKEVFIARYEQ